MESVFLNSKNLETIDLVSFGLIVMYKVWKIWESGLVGVPTKVPMQMSTNWVALTGEEEPERDAAQRNNMNTLSKKQISKKRCKSDRV